MKASRFALVSGVAQGDPGSPVFIPLMFLISLIGGTFAALPISEISALADFFLRRGRNPIWLPPILILFVTGESGAASGCEGALVVGMVCGVAVAFSLYGFAVRSTWFFSRLMLRIFFLPPCSAKRVASLLFSHVHRPVPDRGYGASSL